MPLHITRLAACTAAGVAILAMPAIAGATNLTLSQYTATASPSSVFVLDVGVADVRAGSAVGAYDITLHYDASLWSARSVDFNSFLSGADPMGSMATADFSVLGQVQLQEVSFVTPLDPQPLDVLQPQSFTFATIRFAAVGQGTSGFGFSQAALYDAWGDPMAVTAVPEPSSMVLAVLGLAGLGLRQARQRRARTSG